MPCKSYGHISFSDNVVVCAFFIGLPRNLSNFKVQQNAFSGQNFGKNKFDSPSPQFEILRIRYCEISTVKSETETKCQLIL